MVSDPLRCKARVSHSHSFRAAQCQRKAKVDGYCAQHHPDAVAQRRAESRARYSIKAQKDPYVQLARAGERIQELEAEVTRLKADLDARLGTMMMREANNAE